MISDLPGNSLTDTGDSTVNVSADIFVEASDDSLTISGSFTNYRNDSVKIAYKLETEKKGISGISKSTQSGEVLVPDGGTIVVSRASFNYSYEDVFDVILTINAGKEIIAEKKLTFSGKKFYSGQEIEN